MALHTITTTAELHNYLHAAIQLEHATIPPYLTALYSLDPITNAEAFRVIRVVAVEEMLHLTLAANVLNAVGGTPDLTGADFVPTYPAHLPDGETDFEVSIRPFSKDAIETFLKIERPAQHGGGERFVERERSDRAVLPAFHGDDHSELHFYSIGEFYAEIGHGLDRLHQEMGDALFCGDPARQATPDYYYSGGGEIVPVTDLASAQAALRLISEQGEGLGGRIYDFEDELAHEYRFEQLVLGRYYQAGDEAGAPTGPPLEVDWHASLPVKVDARLDDYPPGSELRAAALRFSEVYQGFLALLTAAFGGRPALLLDAVGEMFRLKELALQIMRNPIPGADGVNGAPIFQPQVREAV